MSNNQTKPNQTQTTPIGSAQGISRSRVEAPKRSYTDISTERTPMRERYAKELAWAAEHLPFEYGPFVALGIERIRRRGGSPSTQSVMAYLRELGRDAASRESGEDAA